MSTNKIVIINIITFSNSLDTVNGHETAEPLAELGTEHQQDHRVKCSGLLRAGGMLVLVNVHNVLVMFQNRQRRLHSVNCGDYSEYESI